MPTPENLSNWLRMRSTKLNRWRFPKIGFATAMEPPVPPDDSDCCNSGCSPCILDVYEAQLKKYKEFLEKTDKVQNCSLDVINAISLSSYTTFVLSERERLSPNVFLLKFEYADLKDQNPNCFQYKSGQYILLRGRDDENEFTRAYTPLPFKNDGLGFTILVRIYDIGQMSTFFKKLQIGDRTSWRGPYGDFSINYNYKYLFFIAQGTGIAPIYSIIQEIVHCDECESFVKLFFCCRDVDDILLREQLYGLTSYWNFNYEIFLSDKTNIDTKYNEIIHEDRLESSDIEIYIKGKSKLQVVICGSENFNQCFKNEVEKLGIESSHIYLF